MAGWALIIPIDASQPVQETPRWETRPLWLGTLASSHSTVSYMSVLEFGRAEPADVRLVVDELALRLPAPAHVLVDEDEAFLAEVHVRRRPSAGSCPGRRGSRRRHRA